MKRITVFWCTILAGGLLISSLIFGWQACAADQNPCSEDIAKFCKDIKPGWAATMQCLERHETELSDACKDYEARMERPRVESREALYQQMRVRQACRDDVTKFCSDTKGGTEGMACLKKHAGELSMACREAVEAVRGGEDERKTR